jgi:hypothetical protein
MPGRPVGKVFGEQGSLNRMLLEFQNAEAELSSRSHLFSSHAFL